MPRMDKFPAYEDFFPTFLWHSHVLFQEPVLETC